MAFGTKKSVVAAPSPQEMANTGVWIWTLRRLKRIQERGW